MQQPVLYAMAALAALCFGCCQAASKLTHDECAVLRTSAQSVVTRQYDTIGVRAVCLHPLRFFKLDDTAVYRKHTSWRAYDTQQYQLGAVKVCI